MNKKFLSVIFTVTIVSVVAYLGCNNGSNPLGPDPRALRYVSADVCATCHLTIGSEWNQTGHAGAIENVLSSDHGGPNCYACMATGYDEDPALSAFDGEDLNATVKFGGVQCEACHGPGSQHIADRVKLPANYDAALCGGCHEGSRHGVYEEWEESAHAHALEGPREASSHFSLHCLECHSTDYRFADSVSEDATPFDFEFGITCADCHDPHSEENEYQLRKPVLELCAECHTAGGAVPGDSPHHPHGDVIQGTGGYEYPGGTYENTAHTYLADGCAECHMWSQPYNATGEGEAIITGHTWEPLVQTCAECHEGLDTFDRNGAQTEIQALLDELAAELDAATENDMLTLSFERAEFNHHFVDADGSLGIHNHRYVKALLEDSIADFEPGS